MIEFLIIFNENEEVSIFMKFLFVIYNIDTVLIKIIVDPIKIILLF